MIAGLEAISAGEILIDGKVVNKLEPRERGCAMVFQNYALYPHMTVGENIGYGLKVAGVPRTEREARVASVARTLGLGEFLDRRPAALSGGQRQRVAMGRAMIREPRVFLFDEPLSNLDAKLRVQMRVEIRRLHNRLKATSIFVTHDQIEAMTLADQLVVLNKGRVEQVGTPAEIYHRPASRFVADFIGSPPMNFLEATVEADAVLHLEGGQNLHAPTCGLPPGHKVTLGFRPESVELASGPGENVLAFNVEMTEELGAGQLAHGRLGDVEAVLSLPPSSNRKGAGVLAIRLPPQAVNLFDATTGARIDMPAPASQKPIEALA
jgi:sn-glycerol 3-phosphate transport system ATP-binding protein